MKRGIRNTLINVAIESVARNNDYNDFWEYVRAVNETTDFEVERLLETYKDLILREAQNKKREFDSWPSSIKLGYFDD